MEVLVTLAACFGRPTKHAIQQRKLTDKELLLRIVMSPKRAGLSMRRAVGSLIPS